MKRPNIAAVDQATPANIVAKAFQAPAARRADDQWWKWPNVVKGFQLAADERLAQPPTFPTPRQQRGIVIVGGGQYLPSVYVTVRVLRHVGCTLPIEVWHFEGEDEPRMTAAIREYDVRFCNADRFAKAMPSRFLEWHWWKGWQLKAFALLQTGFREVLFLDADCYPVRDPEYLFDWPDFKQRGAVFWPDLQNSPSTLSPAVFSLFGTSLPDDRLTESGQILIDRERSWKSLALAAFYNESADVVYHYIWGDKDTFPFAWRRNGQAYSRMWPHCEARADCLLQFDYNGHVVFQHRVGDKFKLNPSRFASTDQTHSENTYHASLAHESFCFHALGELRKLMNGAPAANRRQASRSAISGLNNAPSNNAPSNNSPALSDPRSIEQMYPPVPVSLLCRDEWQQRFHKDFLATGEFEADPFEFSRIRERPQTRCVSVSIFRQNADNQVPHQYPVDSATWSRKYWAGLRNLAEEIRELPDWKLRIHAEKDLVDDVVQTFGAHDQVEIFGMLTNSVGAAPGTLWRFLGLADPSLELALEVDIDEPLLPKLPCVRSFELDPESALGRIGGFESDNGYLVSPGQSAVKNYATVIASCVMSRPAHWKIDLAAAMRGFMAYRRHLAHSAKPWSYADQERPSAFNLPVGGHTLGWGSHWYTYGFDERFLKHVLYYHFADQGTLHTWAPGLPPARMSAEGLRDREYVTRRGNPCVDPQFVARVAPLQLSSSDLRIAAFIDQHRWIFDRLLQLMHRHSETGFCGNLFFDDINDPDCLAHVPKQVGLFRSARFASNALEIGFNAGHSAALMLLANAQLRVRAFDTCGHAYTRPCLAFLNATFADRITLVEGPSQKTVGADEVAGYDLVHIDGDHEYSAVRCDLANSLPRSTHGATVVMDDCLPGNSVERAVLERSDLLQIGAYHRQTDAHVSGQRIYAYRPRQGR